MIADVAVGSCWCFLEARENQSQECCHAGFPERVQQQAHSLLCVSAAAEQLHSLAGTLQSNAYNVYSLALPEDIHAWSGESLAAAAALLLGNPAESEEDDDIWPDVIMNEVTSIEGTRQCPLYPHPALFRSFAKGTIC